MEFTVLNLKDFPGRTWEVLIEGISTMGLCEHDKVMYKKLDYGILRWIVDYMWGDGRTIGDGGCHSD